MTSAISEMNAAEMGNALTARVASRIHSIDVFEIIDSTNCWLLDREPPPPGQLALVIAHTQTRGRGRRGRQWLSEEGGGLWASFGYCFSSRPDDLTTLSLVAGIAVRRALMTITDSVKLKWPNDIVVSGKKLGGILIELKTGPAGSVYAVIGIGINTRAPGTSSLSTPAIGLADASEHAPTPGRLAASLADHLIEAIDTFVDSGFSAFADEWQSADILFDRSVTVTLDNKQIDGIARGIDANGSLLVEHTGIVSPYTSGDVSVRLA